jgi:hypothetical protein
MNRFFAFIALSILNAIFLIACSVLFTACDKSAASGPPPEKHGTMLFEETTDNGNTIRKKTYYYSADSLIEKLVDTSWSDSSADDKHLLTKMEFQWDKSKQVEKILYYDFDLVQDPVVEISKAPNHYIVRRTTYKTPVSTTFYDHWYGVDNKNRVIADTSFDVQQNRIAFYHVYTYDANDNVDTEEIFYAAGNGYARRYLNTYTYDRKKNPNYYFKNELWTGLHELFYAPYGSKNNILAVDYSDEFTGRKWNYRTYIYTYNSNDLPITRSFHDMNTGYSESTSFTYK